MFYEFFPLFTAYPQTLNEGPCFVLIHLISIQAILHILKILAFFMGIVIVRMGGSGRQGFLKPEDFLS